MGSDDRDEERKTHKANLNSKWEEDKLTLKRKLEQSAGAATSSTQGDAASYSATAVGAEANREIGLFKKDHLARFDQMQKEGILSAEE